jgi:hypothetical protein
LVCFEACFCRAPRGREGSDVRRQFLEASGVRSDKRRVVKLFRDNDMHDRQGEGSVRPRPDEQHFIRLSLCFGSPHVDRDDFGAASPCRDNMAGRIGLAPAIGAAIIANLGVQILWGERR